MAFVFTIFKLKVGATLRSKERRETDAKSEKEKGTLKYVQ